MKCHNCQSEIMETDKFCSECGSSLAIGKPCFACKSICKPEANFYHECGTNLKPQEPMLPDPNDAKAIMDYYQFTEQEIENGIYSCYKCQNPLKLPTKKERLLGGEIVTYDGSIFEDETGTWIECKRCNEINFHSYEKDSAPIETTSNNISLEKNPAIVSGGGHVQQLSLLDIEN